MIKMIPTEDSYDRYTNVESPNTFHVGFLK